MLENNELNISTLRMIRIVKNLKPKDMAELFEVTPAYINALESSKKNITIKTLKKGLDKLNITLVQYYELEQFKEYIIGLTLNDQNKFKFMLIKTLGTITPELKEETEELLNTYLYSKTR